MSKSKNTKDEQQKDLCITSEQLTEQWKKGKLPSGWYWVEGSRAEGIYAYTAEYLNNMYRPRNGEIIIEQVPSYGELQNMNKAVNECMAANIKLVEQNKQLKELLKECRSPINYALCLNLSEEDKKEFKNLLAEIKKVLGEE